MLIPLLALLFQPSASVGGSGYGAPAVSYGAPEESYGAPAPAYGAPGYSSRSVSTFYLLHHIPTYPYYALGRVPSTWYSSFHKLLTKTLDSMIPVIMTI